MATTDPQRTTISQRELSFGYWIATHRRLLHRILIGFLSILAASQIGTFVYTSINWVSHIQETSDILTDLGSSDVLFDAIRRPVDIAVHSAQAVIRDDHSIDVVVNLQNQNDIWAATDITYEITIGGSSTGVSNTTLAPQEEKFLTKQSLPFSGTSAPAVQVNITDVTWKKFVDTSRLPTDNWIYTNAHYGYVQSSAADVPFKTELTFTVQNKSLYGYREVNVVAVLQDESGNIHGIGSVILEEMRSEQAKTLTFRWPLRLPTDSTPVIHVNVDHLNEDNIIRTRD
jgi:hypothetical protein